MSLRRPLLLRLLPLRFRESFFWRFYWRRHEHWLHLYEHAELLAAPGVTMQLVPGDVLSDVVAFTGIHEPELTRRIITLGRKGGMMIDIGANLGYFSLLWASANPSNQAIAIEAAPRNVEILRKNVEQNGLANSIQIVPCAAAAKTGKLYFDLGPEDQRGWGGISPNGDGNQIEVAAVRVDELVNSDVNISILKVDTEGADAWALMGCERLLKNKSVNEIWFEQNKPRMDQLGIPANAALEYLESVGYTCKAHNNPSDTLVEWSAFPRLD